MFLKIKLEVVIYLLIFIFLYTVAAYNAGARNVERTLMNSTKLGPAAKKANSMNEKKLYRKLVDGLEYRETPNYLQKVWTRKEKYE